MTQLVRNLRAYRQLPDADSLDLQYNRPVARAQRAMAFSLTPNERDLLSARADQFNAARERGGAVDWDAYLTDLAGPVRVAVISELIVIDLDHRWKSGDRPLLEEYVERFPELASDDALPGKLIVEECRLRVQAGETVEVSSYQSRFPGQYDSVRDSLEGLLKNSKKPSKLSAVMKNHSIDSLVNVAQQYQLIRQLGRGMFGEVWLARKNPSGIEKAIKILLHPIDDDGAKREMRSLELIKNLRHPYLLSTEDFWISDNRLHIAMELADSTVRVRFKQCQEMGLPGLPADELMQFIGEAAEGLDYLHEQKITHRDVKPDNILLLRGHAKVADFGLARQQDNMMASMSFAGTPAYMAPEVWGGEGGPASDQYSLAFVTLELLQGRSPLKLGPMTEMMMAHLDGKYEYMPMVTDAERKVFSKALSRYPQDRYASCSEFAAELAKAMGRNSLRMPRQTATASTVPMMSPASSSAATAADTQIPSMLGSIAIGNQPSTAKSKQPSQAGVRTIGPRGTIAEIKGPASVSVRRSSAKTGSKLPVILGGVVLLLLMGVGIVALTIFGGSGTPTSTGSTPTSETTVTTIHTTTKLTTTTTKFTPPPVEVIPAGATAEPTAKRQKLGDGRVVPEWITYTIGGDKVRFRLIAGGGTVQPFFMSETKVTNSVYRAGGGNPKEALGGDKAPIVSVTAEEAWAFAAKQFQGRLPTAEEWDYAVGLPGAAPGATTISLPATDAWINKSTPGAVNRAQADMNSNDLIDMAGNGREWTSTILVGRDKPTRNVDTGKFEKKELVIVRGRSYTLTRPLTFNMLAFEQKEPQTEFAGMSSPYTSFRVVVPVPK